MQSWIKRSRYCFVFCSHASCITLTLGVESSNMVNNFLQSEAETLLYYFTVFKCIFISIRISRPHRRTRRWTVCWSPSHCWLLQEMKTKLFKKYKIKKNSFLFAKKKMCYTNLGRLMSFVFVENTELAATENCRGSKHSICLLLENNGSSVLFCLPWIHRNDCYAIMEISS